MEIIGLDRVIMLVKDMDKAMDFFFRKLGIEFIELPGSEEFGQRASMSIDYQIELIAPILPVPEDAPAHIRRWAKYLDDRDNVLIALAFHVGDAEAAAVDAEQKGIGILDKMSSVDLPPLQICDIKEILMSEGDTLGIPMALIEYKRK
jgi:catechol 2,3-dioxygenase-like lactoylglutathione lyase family enzyme